MMTQDIATQAQILVDSGQAANAVALLERGVAMGDAHAMFTLSVWLLAGQDLPRDLVRARALLRDAVRIGHVDGALLEIALIATGSGGPADWRAALSALKIAAQHDPIAKAQLDLIDAMELSADGNPIKRPSSETLSTSPHVQYIPALLTAAECAHIAGVAGPMLEPAMVVDPSSGRMINHPIRTSFGGIIGPGHENLVIHAINRRIAAISDTQVEQGEPLTVLRYAPGQQYRPHHDGLTGARNQRIRTVLVYLNHGYRGGETAFLANGLKVLAKGGDAVIFDNVLPDGRLDLKAKHAGMPVTHGTKWIATRWIRAAPYDPWTASN